MTHERFESKAVSMLLEGIDPNLKRLEKQFLSAKVSKREETETGFIVFFKVPKYLAVDKITKQISGVKVVLADVEVLDLQLVVLEGIITQLNATYTSDIKSLDLIRQSDDLAFAYVSNIASVLKNELDQNSILLEKAEQLLSENMEIGELIAKYKARKLELTKNLEYLFAENNRTRQLLEQEQINNIELAKEIDQLLTERTKINALLVKGQTQNLKLAETVNELKKSLEYLKLEPIEPVEVVSETMHHEPVIVNQREKLSSIFEKITDNFLNKLFAKKVDVNEYRRKTKYHLAVWKMAFVMGINSLFYLCFTGAFVMILLLGAQNVLGGLHSVMGFSALRVVSASMEPEIPVNSLVVIRQDDPNNLKIGQIATYLRDDGFLITHRILHIEEDDGGNKTGFILKGDANPRPSEQIVSSENIMGRVVFISNAIGQMLLFLETRFMVIFVLTIFLLTVLYVGKRKSRQKMNETT